MFILATDLHLTDRPDDEYRFDLFPFLVGQVESQKAKATFLLGDLTDFKDNHSAKLVNEVVNALTKISALCPLIILMGNHDYVDPGRPFFGFLNQINNITFVTKPTNLVVGGKDFLLLPHTRNPHKDWSKLDFAAPDFIMCHHTFKGAIASNGQAMDGEEAGQVLGQTKAKVFSGDIHVPQTLGPINYVGSPYRIRFGDVYKPRCVLLSDSKQTTDIHLQTIQKHTVYLDSPEELMAAPGLVSGDQVKIRFRLKREDAHLWPSIRKEIVAYAEGGGLKLHGLEAILDGSGNKLADNDGLDESSQVVRQNRRGWTKLDLFDAYCNKEEVSEYDQDTGRALIENFDTRVPTEA